MNMKKATFYVDHCYDGSSDEYGCRLSGRYRFDMSLSDDEYEELYEVWESHDEELNSWHTDWTDQKEWFNSINGVAIYALQQVLEKYEPGIASFMTPSLDVLWELSPETAEEF